MNVFGSGRQTSDLLRLYTNLVALDCHFSNYHFLTRVLVHITVILLALAGFSSTCRNLDWHRLACTNLKMCEVFLIFYRIQKKNHTCWVVSHTFNLSNPEAQAGGSPKFKDSQGNTK